MLTDRNGRRASAYLNVVDAECCQRCDARARNARRLEVLHGLQAGLELGHWRCHGVCVCLGLCFNVALCVVGSTSQRRPCLQVCKCAEICSKRLAAEKETRKGRRKYTRGRCEPRNERTLSTRSVDVEDAVSKARQACLVEKLCSNLSISNALVLVLDLYSSTDPCQGQLQALDLDMQFTEQS